MKTYGSIKYKDNSWILTVEPHVSLRLKDVFRKINKASTDSISISNSQVVCKDLDWFMMRYPLEISQKDEAILKAGVHGFDSDQRDLETILLPTYKPSTIDMLKPLRPYQSIACDLLLKKKRLLCGDDVGLGKTAIGLGAIAATNKPAIVVCQTHLPNQWKREVESFLGVSVHIINKRRIYPLPKADVYIISYSKLSGWNEILCQGFFKTVVFDEIQELRISGSDKYGAARLLASAAEYVLGLSATPVYNYGGEIYAVLNLISPGCLGNWNEFTREWCNNYLYDNKVRVKDPKVLGSYLRENFLMIRRTREEVGKELPQVNQIVHEVEYNESYVKKAEKELKEIAARVLTGSFTERGQAARMLDAQARMMTGVAKAQGVADYVKILLENGEKILLAGWHRDCYDIWLEELKDYNPVMYTGSESPTQKEKSKAAFLSGESKVMIMSLRSGVGLDGLQLSCNIVVFGELDYSPGVHEQVKGRLQRDGQASQVTAIYLTTDNGTDPLMIDILGLKASQASGILNPTQEILETVSDDEKIKRLAKMILDK